METAKSFDISKELVWQAYKLVKANGGAAGVDGQSLLEFDQDLSNNLYRIWNRMASGSYFPPPVKAREIPKKSGGKRILGIPTVSDRIAQMVVKLRLEPKVEPHFHEDSYGYRPGKSAHQALDVTRRRCWRYDWVLEFDIRGLFDNIDHELLMKAVRKHTDCKWTILYIQRWLTAPMQMQNGDVMKRDRGTPQGGVISPLLANLFLHYAFDKWMTKNFPEVPFCRYADDGLLHCRSLEQAQLMHERIDQRFKECGLELHPDKTKIIYCKDSDRRGEYEHIRFDFLG
jgi:RNA-directed DNA polymerase